MEEILDEYLREYGDVADLECRDKTSKQQIREACARGGGKTGAEPAGPRHFEAKVGF
ncbi:MAG: hypothetical protein OXI87_05550 [Albidovulum sp.]|nr:hypothetical protein [Albidovulum sp.]MDE0531620.1 hypothetical protein [Albidovulum sp.]